MECRGKYHIGEQWRQICQRVSGLVSAGQEDNGFGSLLAHRLGRELPRQARGQAIHKTCRARDERLQQAEQAKVIPYPRRRKPQPLSACF